MSIISFGCWGRGTVDPWLKTWAAGNQKISAQHMAKQAAKITLPLSALLYSLAIEVNTHPRPKCIIITGDNYYPYNNDDPYEKVHESQSIQGIRITQGGGGGNKECIVENLEDSFNTLVKICEGKVPIYMCTGNHENPKNQHDFFTRAATWSKSGKPDSKSGKPDSKSGKPDSKSGKTGTRGAELPREIPKKKLKYDNLQEWEASLLDQPLNEFFMMGGRTQQIEGGSIGVDDNIKFNIIDTENKIKAVETELVDEHPGFIFGHKPLFALHFKPRKSEKEIREKVVRKLGKVYADGPTTQQIDEGVKEAKAEAQKKGDAGGRQWDINDNVVEYFKDLSTLHEGKSCVYICADTHNYQDIEITFKERDAPDTARFHVRQIVVGAGGTFKMDDLYMAAGEPPEPEPEPEPDRITEDARIRDIMGRFSIEEINLKHCISGQHGFVRCDIGAPGEHVFLPFFDAVEGRPIPSEGKSKRKRKRKSKRKRKRKRRSKRKSKRNLNENRNGKIND